MEWRSREGQSDCPWVSELSPPQRPLCIVGKLSCCGEAGEKEKESARGRFPLPIVPRGLRGCRAGDDHEKGAD